MSDTTPRKDHQKSFLRHRVEIREQEEIQPTRLDGWNLRRGNTILPVGAIKRRGADLGLRRQAFRCRGVSGLPGALDHLRADRGVRQPSVPGQASRTSAEKLWNLPNLEDNLFTVRLDSPPDDYPVPICSLAMVIVGVVIRGIPPKTPIL
jgi:hypothetical protein